MTEPENEYNRPNEEATCKVSRRRLNCHGLSHLVRGGYILPRPPQTRLSAVSYSLPSHLHAQVNFQVRLSDALDVVFETNGAEPVVFVQGHEQAAYIPGGFVCLCRNVHFRDRLS